MNKNDKLVRNIGIAVFLIMLLTSIIFGGLGGSGSSEGNGGDHDILQGLVLQKGTTAQSDELQESGSVEIEVPENDIIIKNMTVKLSWSDESEPPGRPRVRRYENQPDTFSLRVAQSNGNSSSDSGSNRIGSPGTLEVTISLEDDELSELYKAGTAGNGTWLVEISLTDCGMWIPVLGPGLIGLTDSGNEFSVSIDYEYYDLSGDEGEG
ncbi:MAG: hypothetical protein ACMUHB_02205 [Thermoplasmatota archaeon]